MSGEMIYIIDQRLNAQKISKEKYGRVLNDIILSIFNCKLTQEVFRPHNQITFYVLRIIFEKLVHSSIMRLNEQSMSNLFDLMIMVIKYQLYGCRKPSDLMTITDNHFISIIQMLKDNNNGNNNQNIIEIVNVVRNQFMLHYQNYDSLCFQQIRYNLLNFFKDIRTRVSIFLRKGWQTNDGQFVIPYENVHVECECQIPGIVRYFVDGSYQNIRRIEHFDVGGNYLIDDNDGGRTKLGLNIYKNENEPKPNGKLGNDNRQEMDLLAKLLCKTQDVRRESIVELKFDFLSTNDQNNDDDNNNNGSIQIVDGNQDDNQQLNDIIQDLRELCSFNNEIHKQSSNDDDQQQQQIDDIDLLQLMDL